MDRRTFIGIAAALVGTASVRAAAQPVGGLPRIGFVSNADPKAGAPAVDALRRGLRELGWIEGQNLAIEYRWAEGRPDRLPQLVAELVQSKVDVIVLSGVPAVRAAQQATTTIPVVFVVLVDPVAMGSCEASRVPAAT